MTTRSALSSTYTLLLSSLLLLILSINSSFAEPFPAARERLSLDRGWLFHLGDVPMPELKGHGVSYANAKAGNAWAAAGRVFDDSDWRKLDLPHDWAVEGPFDPNENISQGYRPRGIGWYRRYLRIDESDRGQHFELQFDAIATHSTVWINGNIVNRNWSGYNASYIDITPYLRYGDGMNTIAIKVDAEAMEGWWYEGAGIYRHAWLMKRGPVHVITDGVHATPRYVNESWQLPVTVSLANSGEQSENIDVEVNIYHPDGTLLQHQNRSINVNALQESEAHLDFEFDSVALWSLESTQLYRVETLIKQQGKIVDSTSLKTGFRTIRFDAEQGFFLNGQHVKLQGVCIHQDHAGVGVAIPDSIWEYRLRRLKELGVNAIRFSHNAPAAETLDLVDRMGFLVMDENRNFNPSPDYMQQLNWMVRRDRHHPGIILWSVFNEEPVQASEVGYQMARRMTAAVKSLDDTRPVTAAMNGGFFTELNVSHAVDVLGANYQVPDYDRFHQARPTVPFTSSEDTSAFMTRGEFTTDYSKNVIASYDDDFAFWGNSHRDAWQAIASRDYVAGGFVWTGFDYRGEPTPFEWPSVSSSFGIMDLNGFPKTAYFMHQVQWIKDQPLVYIAPHWNWSGKEGQDIKVMIMANTDSVTLFLNDKEIGKQIVDPYQMNTFAVPYSPGKLEVIAYNQGKEVARNSVETTGKAVAISLTPDRDNLVGNGRDTMPITVQALDSKGRPVPIDNSLITFEVSGAGHSIGHGNGNPNSHEDEKGPTRHLFNGLAQLIVQSDYESQGNIIVKASSPSLKNAVLRIPVKAIAAQPYVKSYDAPPMYITDWRISPISTTRPDPLQTLADNDMNTWGWGQPPMMEQISSDKELHYRIYRTQFTPRKSAKTLYFEALAGQVEIWLNDELVAKNDSDENEALSIPLPQDTGKVQLNVLVKSTNKAQAGVQGAVIVRE